MASKRIMKWGIKKTNWWCSFKILRIVSIALRRANFSWCENLKSVLLPGALPPWPPTGRCPVPRWGPRRPPDPSPPGGPPAPSAAYSLQSFPWMVQEIEATPPGQNAYDNNSGTVTTCWPPTPCLRQPCVLSFDQTTHWYSVGAKKWQWKLAEKKSRALP